MNKKEKLIDYLYGEMDEAARQDFERQLAADASLRAELEALQHTRQTIQELPAAEPPLRLVTLPARPSPWKRWAGATAVAAGFFLLLGLLTPRIELGNGKLVLTLGRSAEQVPATPHTPPPAPDQQLARLDSLWQERLLAREAALRQEWQELLTATAKSQEAKARRYADQQWNEQLPQLAGMMQDLQLQQQQELQLLLTGFWEHYQQTRAADLQSIETEFANLYRSR